jgi:2-oxo-3-hexenedioate decarboxylase
MTLGPDEIAQLAAQLDECEMAGGELALVMQAYPAFGLADGYAVQDAIRRRKIGQGRRVTGFKVGLTSAANMAAMGAQGPCFGFLVDNFALPEHGVCALGTMRRPKVEPEIAFVTKRVLKGPGCHIASVLAATDFVLAGIEIVDSRYRDGKFDLASMIADNACASRFVLGSKPMPLDEIDLRTVGIVLEKNGKAVGFGAGAAVLSHPAAAVAMLANHLGARGEEIPAGSLVFSGSIIDAVPVEAGDSVTLRMQGMGSTGVRFVA